MSESPTYQRKARPVTRLVRLRRWLVNLLLARVRGNVDWVKRTCNRQDETELKTGFQSAFRKYEINVAQHGRHVFATDRTIRSYSDAHVASLIKLFREVFPENAGYRITVTPYGFNSPPLPDVILEEMSLEVRETTSQS